MPPKRKLPTEIIADFVKWIDMGAPDPREGKVIAKKDHRHRQGPQVLGVSSRSASRRLPAVKNAAWARTPVDRFILAKLEEKKLTPNGADQPGDG